jgi:hypothetical protein
MTSTEEYLQGLTVQAAELAAAVSELNTNMAATVTGLAVVVKKDRRRVRWLAASVAVDVLLSMGFGYIALQTREAQHAAETNRSNAVITCEVANQTRASQVQLWTYVISLNGKPRTSVEVEKLRKFEIYLGEVFAPRDCANPTKVNPPPTPPSK